MSEVDLGDWNDSSVSVGTIDCGLLPDATIAAKHPVPTPRWAHRTTHAACALRWSRCCVKLRRTVTRSSACPRRFSVWVRSTSRTRVSSGRTGRARTALMLAGVVELIDIPVGGRADGRAPAHRAERSRGPASLRAGETRREDCGAHQGRLAEAARHRHLRGGRQVRQDE